MMLGGRSSYPGGNICLSIFASGAPCEVCLRLAYPPGRNMAGG
uniref:Uncharacterized protein n=1 Tax=Arundo donax TaxID=35708 RepID=A0A0A8ZW65_ARUDO